MYRNATFALLGALPLAAAPVEVGKYSAKIVPERVSVLTIPEMGVLSDLANAQERLEAGTVIAILNKERTEEAREDMELQIARERINKRDEIQKLRNQRRKVVFYNSLSADERRFNSDFKSDDQPGKTTLQDLDERISLLERELKTIERRKRKEFSDKHDKLTLRMPFRGRLQYNITLPEDTSKPFEYTETVRSFATVCDDSAFYITISIADSNLSLLDEKRFSASVKLPGERLLTGTYAHRRVERNPSGGDMLVYFFRLPESEHETAYNMLGSNTSAELIYETDGEALTVNKADLVMHPDAAECESWEQLIRKTHPAYKILIIGRRELVLVPAGK